MRQYVELVGFISMLSVISCMQDDHYLVLLLINYNTKDDPVDDPVE